MLRHFQMHHLNTLHQYEGREFTVLQASFVLRYSHNTHAHTNTCADSVANSNRKPAIIAAKRNTERGKEEIDKENEAAHSLLKGAGGP